MSWNDIVLFLLGNGLTDTEFRLLWITIALMLVLIPCTLSYLFKKVVQFANWVLTAFWNMYLEHKKRKELRI